MLETDQLTFSIDNKNLIDNLSLNFSNGKLHGIIGPNGSGKSTFLKLLNGILKATKGRVLFNRENLAEKSPKEISKLIAYVPQTFTSCFDYSVEEIVMMGGYSRGSISKELQENQLISVLNLVDSLHLRNRYTQSLSGGEKQRIYIARALMADSPVILLDEPTASLDIGHQLEIWQLLTDLKTNKLIIVTVHDLNYAEKFCDRLYLLKAGCCIAEGGMECPLLQINLQETFGITHNPEESLRAYQLT